MEIIQLAGYSDTEKLNIAKQYLIARQIKENGLQENQLEITDDAINLLTARYTREAGVRQLERTIGNLTRKVALKVAQGDAEKVRLPKRIKGISARRVLIPKRRVTKIGGRSDMNGLDGNLREVLFFERQCAGRFSLLWPDNREY